MPDRGVRRVPRWPVSSECSWLRRSRISRPSIAETAAPSSSRCSSRRSCCVATRSSFSGRSSFITAVWLASRSSARARQCRFALAGFYIGYTQKVLPSSPVACWRISRLAGFAALLIAAGAYLARKRARLDWVLLLWSGATLLVTAVAGQPFPHFLAPAVAPLALLLAGISRCRRRPGFEADRLEARRGVAPQIAGVRDRRRSWPRVAGFDWIPRDHASPRGHALAQPVLRGAVQAALRSDGWTAWGNEFDARVEGDTDVVDWLTQHGLRGTTAVIWSSDAWVYALADLQIVLPTPPIYNDEVLLGFNGPVENSSPNGASRRHRDRRRTRCSSIRRSRELLDGVTYVRAFRQLPGRRLDAGGHGGAAPVSLHRRAPRSPTAASRARARRCHRRLRRVRHRLHAHHADRRVSRRALASYYINGIADHLRLPPAGEPERQQPPLYYLLGAAGLEAHRWRPTADPAPVGRARNAHHPDRLPGGAPAVPKPPDARTRDCRDSWRCCRKRSIWLAPSTTTTLRGSPEPCWCSPASPCSRQRT